MGNVKVITSKADTAIILLILIIFFLISVVVLINALIHRNIFIVLTVSLFAIGIFNIIRHIVKKPTGKK